MLNLRGISFAIQADCTTAQIYFQRAIRLDPSCPEPVWNLALLYFAAGSVAEALELFLYLLDGNFFKPGKQHRDTTVVVTTPPRCALPCRRAILWAVASAAIALKDWALALSALEEIDVAPFPKAISSPFRMGCQIIGIEIRRALAYVLLHLGRAEDALRTCLEVCRFCIDHNL
jgi:tetratricopeptide (TPR) repeat protein